MLSKTRSVKKLATRLALFVPVLALCFYCFNQEIVAKPQYTVISDPTPDVYDAKIDKSLDLLMGQYTNKIESKIFNGKNPSAVQISQWVKDGFQFTINHKSVNSEKLNEYEPDDFSIYWGLKLIDTVSGKQISGFVGFATNEYYNFVNKTRADLIANFKKDNVWDYDYAPGSSELYKNTLSIEVFEDLISVNSQPTSLEDFAKVVDALSKDWTLNDKRTYRLYLRSQDPKEGVWSQLQDAFQATALYKVSPKKLLPPSSIPTAPKKGTPASPPAPPKTPVISKGKSKSVAANRLETIHIEIDKNTTIYVNNKATKESEIKQELLRYNQGVSKEVLENMTIPITVDPNIPMGVLTDVKSALREYGVYKHNIRSTEERDKRQIIPAVNESDLPVLPENEKTLPQPTTKSQYINNLKVMKRHGAAFYLDGIETNYDEALKFIKLRLKNGQKPKVTSSFDPDTVQIFTKE